eukprot:scaffold81402_cov19-Tisochrysis_lutea.AAC.1
MQRACIPAFAMQARVGARQPHFHHSPLLVATTHPGQSSVSAHALQGLHRHASGRGVHGAV